MFDILSDIVEGTVDVVSDGVGSVAEIVVDTADSVSDTTKKLLNGVTPDAGTIQGLLDTGMTIYEMSDVTGIAVAVLEGILEG